MGLEDWQPGEGVQYDLVWIQWCAGHLTDAQLVQFLERCKATLNPDGGVIVVKENNATVGQDQFDDVDSSVTRCVHARPLRPGGVSNQAPRNDGTFRRIFADAGLSLVQAELQKGFQVAGASLLPVRMYALRPAQ
jgi:protein N-terminal methyltransferase